MRVFITGNKGQLGKALLARMPEAMGGDLPECDVADAACIRDALEAARPDVVLHCAAMTDVDGAARDPDLAYRVNGLGTQNVALAAEAVGAAVLYISTNEVFDGRAERPYAEFDTVNPINPYAQSKRAGEWFVLNLCRRFYIVRTAWLFGRGGRNFVHRIRQLADEGRPLRVVTDEVASPTYVEDLAGAVVRLVESGQFGIYHLVNDGHCSRYDFARKILDFTGHAGVPVERITLADYPRATTPPSFTPLANVCARALGIRLRPWEDALAEFLEVER